MRVGKPDLFLVVNDAPDILERLVESLRNEGFVTLAAGNGAAALHPVMEITVHLMTGDTKRPHLGGMVERDQVLPLHVCHSRERSGATCDRATRVPRSCGGRSPRRRPR